MEIKKLDDTNYDLATVENKDANKLIMFTAKGCSKCVVAKGIFEEYSQDTEVECYIVDISAKDTTELVSLIERNGLNSLPIFAAYDKEGNILSMKSGVQTLESLDKLFN